MLCQRTAVGIACYVYWQAFAKHDELHSSITHTAGQLASLQQMLTVLAHLQGLGWHPRRLLLWLPEGFHHVFQTTPIMTTARVWSWPPKGLDSSLLPFLHLQGQADRVNYLMTKQAKIVAMTCTHAALKRREFLQLGLKYDNLLMEESAQILEIETFIPMLLQVKHYTSWLTSP